MLLLLFAALSVDRVPQGPCPNANAATEAVAAGWRAYRQSAITEAASHFAVADSLCPGEPRTLVGLGFVALRQEHASEAEKRFARALSADSSDADAWYGLALTRLRQGDAASGTRALRRALRLAPDYAEAVEQLLALGADSGLTPPRPPPPAEPQVPARTEGAQFVVRTVEGWRPFTVKGVNLGAALPGRFPSDVPTDEATYARWLELIAAANANTIRLYTIFPPAFYRALRRWNAAHADRPLWLVHGIWAELPPGNDYDDPAWAADLRREIRRVVDVIHGSGLIAARPGHAWGRYDADVSDHVLAFVLGREWEPFSIGVYNRKRPKQHTYAGRFLAVKRGTPADVWLAAQCDDALQYEWDTYRAQRPIAYTNWPTLDPLHHPTEPSLAEEQALRKRHGFPPNPRLKEYDNDLESLDAMLVRPTPANLAGYFAAYHVYPYYPDFIDLDSSYGAARSSAGPSHYLGYLLDLKRHHAGRPLLIAEYGVPSSRGVSHLQPEGLGHGGHDEREMAALDARLTREIHEAGLAGGIVFSWLDEWFKHTWVTVDLELPPDRTRLWHNMMNAEQNYGLLGEYAGDSTTVPEPGGDPTRWTALSVLERNDAVALRVGADASYLYLALDGGPALDSTRYVVGIDTYRRDRGETTLPGVPLASDVGFEFALVLNDTADAQLLIAPWYNPYLGPRAGAGPTALDPFYNSAVTVDVSKTGGGWDSLFITTNRWRIGRDGRTFPARGVNRGRLRYGQAEETSLADWYVERNKGLIEVRLPWGLLNVTDPSSRRVLQDAAPHDSFEVAVTDGFRFSVAALGRDGGAMRFWLPAHATYTWPTWEEPTWHEHLKPAYAALREVWGTW